MISDICGILQGSVSCCIQELKTAMISAETQEHAIGDTHQNNQKWYVLPWILGGLPMVIWDTTILDNPHFKYDTYISFVEGSVFQLKED